MPASLFSAQETSRVAPQVFPGLRELVDLPAFRGLLVLLVLLGLTASRGPRGLKVTKVLRDLLDVKATKDLQDLRVLVVSKVLNTLHGQVKPLAEGLEKLLSKLAKYELIRLGRIPASLPISTIFKRIQKSYSTLVGRTPSNGEEGEEILVIERFLHLRHILRRFLAGRISNIQTIFATEMPANNSLKVFYFVT